MLSDDSETQDPTVFFREQDQYDTILQELRELKELVKLLLLLFYYLKIFYNGSPISRHYSTVFQGAVHASCINLYIFTKQTYILITIY